jgi:transcriptional regulator with XRE-family HTH domain
MPLNSMASRIKAARLAKGFSKSALAREADVTTTAVWNWEEKDSKPRPDALARLAKALNVSEEYIQSGTVLDSTMLGIKPADIIKTAEQQIAMLNGFPSHRVKLRLEIMPE